MSLGAGSYETNVCKRLPEIPNLKSTISRNRRSPLSVNSLWTTACTIRALIVCPLGTHVLGGTPISSIDRIGCGFLNNLAAARSDVEADEILYGYQVGSALPFVETVVPGAGLVGGRDPRWSESFCIPESVNLVWGISVPSSHWP